RRAFEDEQRPCGRDTDGQVVDVGAWGPCGGFRDACDESGTQQRTTEVCVGGRVDFQDEQRACQRNTDGARCEGDGTCQNERCLHPDICNGIDDDGDGFIDNPEPPERGCMFWITHHTNCQFRSWHGAWQAATSAEERNAASCPPDPNNPLAGCGGCAVAQRVCGVPPYAASYNTCWQEADGNRLRTYVRPQAAQGF
ncbi:hypothetical protein KDM41_18625, partial [bacterium]|nr:hypothetical protein [bacterium]